MWTVEYFKNGDLVEVDENAYLHEDEARYHVSCWCQQGAEFYAYCYLK